jgi:ribonuclease BN (tRNA processing enzyme)
MRITFLGTADGHTSATREHSGILIQTKETTLLLDCGAFAARYLLAKKFSPEVPEAIWISHMHSDHIGQLASLIQSLWLRARRAPLHLYCPAAVISTLQDWLEKCLLFPELLGFRIQWHAIKPGRKYLQTPFILTPFGTQHLKSLAAYFQRDYPLTCFDCYGVSITYNKEKYVYSADLALASDLRPALKQPVKALFCELTHFPEADLFKELAKHKVAQVFITHYPDHLINREQDLVRLARQHKFRGKVRLMHDKRTEEI